MSPQSSLFLQSCLAHCMIPDVYAAVTGKPVVGNYRNMSLWGIFIVGYPILNFLFTFKCFHLQFFILLKIAVDALIIFLIMNWVVICDNFYKFLSLEYHMCILLICIFALNNFFFPESEIKIMSYFPVSLSLGHMEQPLQCRIEFHVKLILVLCLRKVLQFIYVSIPVSYQSAKPFSDLNVSNLSHPKDHSGNWIFPF